MPYNQTGHDKRRLWTVAGGSLGMRSGLRFIVMTATLLLGCTPTMAARPWPDSSSQTIVFADQLPEGMSEAQRQFAATHLAGTQKMRLSEIRALRAYNADFLCLHYQLGIGCGAHAFVVRDEWTSDWAYVNSQASWFLYNTLAQRVHQTAWDWDVMDITGTGGVFHTGFPEYWMTTCLDRITVNEDDGVFADSFTVDGYFDQCNPSHDWFQDVDLCLANWVPSLNAYGAAIKSRFEADGRGYRFLPNLGGLITSWDTTNYRMGHGGMIEGFCFWSPGDYFELSDWQLQMERALSLVRADAIVICQSYIGDTANVADRIFALASYLLIKGHYTYISLIINDGLEFYPEYTLELGEAPGGIPAQLADLWDESWQVYRRRYANGLVVVNPGNNPVTFNLAGTNYLQVAVSGGGAVNEAGEYFGSVSFTVVTTMTVAAHSGAILLTGSAGAGRTPLAGDFDGDQLTDLALYQEQTGTWSFLLSANGYHHLELVGLLGGIGWSALAGDVDGDQLADPVVYEPINSAWSILLSSADYDCLTVTNCLGGVGWRGLMGDFDGDRLADPAICNPTGGHWIISLSANGYQPIVLDGFPDGADWLPLTGDFDGDRLVDPAACQPVSGTWSILLSVNGYARIDITGLLGEAGDLPLAADFDGDRRADPAVYRPTVGTWTLWLSTNGYQPVNVDAWEIP